MDTNNILLSNWELPPFSKIKEEDYEPAMLWAISKAKERIEEICSNEAEPSFSNTILALEFASKELDKISSIFFNLNHANTSDNMQLLAMNLSPVLTEYANSVSLNPVLFAKVKAVYGKGLDQLNNEQQRLVTKCYKSFTRNGANLVSPESDRYKELTTTLAQKTLLFDQNLLAATNSFTLHLTSEEELAGLPDFVREAAAHEAKEREMSGWLITLQAQSMIPFMQYSECRELREKVWRAHSSRCFSGEENNNTEIVKDIVNLRLEKAKLLGFNTHADYILTERMAKNADKVNSFLNELSVASTPFAKKDLATVTSYARTLGFTDELMAWDFAYYSEKYRKDVLTLSEEELKPYFELTNITSSLLELCTTLYGINFTPDSSIDIYHKDVKTYKVTDKNGADLAVLYLDFFPRQTKSGGAWMTSFREYHIEEDAELLPQISVVCNFSKPTSNKPSLLTFNEVTTLFHEFGHALHGMFSRSHYPSLSGTNVSWDFVELPSQIMENWAIEKEFLATSAKHYITGEPIAMELVDKIIESRNFLSGYASVRQLSFGVGDMAWHSIREPYTGSVKEFEQVATQSLSLFPSTDTSCFATAFSHIFSGGYSAGYYSYKWAEVLEADAYTRFMTEGVFNSLTAQDFRDKILSMGDKKDAMDLYIDFMGREPKADALLQKLGLKE